MCLFLNMFSTNWLMSFEFFYELKKKRYLSLFSAFLCVVADGGSLFRIWSVFIMLNFFVVVLFFKVLSLLPAIIFPATLAEE